MSTMAARMRLATDSIGKRIADKKTHQGLTRLPIFFFRNSPVLAFPVVADAFFL